MTSREAIVDAAVEVFDRDGIRGLTMRAVATQAGIGLATLYSYVPDKEALVDLALAGVERDLPEHLTDRARHMHDWVEGIQLWVRTTWTNATQHPGVLELMASQRFLPPGQGARRFLARIVHLAEEEGVPLERVAYALKTASDYAIGLAATQRLDPRHPVLEHLLPERTGNHEYDETVAQVIHEMARLGGEVETRLDTLVSLLCGRETFAPEVGTEA